MFLAHSAKGEIPEQSYRSHVSNVYKMAVNNATKAGAYSKYCGLMKDSVALAALYHDLGKLAPENQEVLRASSKKGLPLHHQDAGVAAMQIGELSLAKNLASLFIYSHHKGLPSLPVEKAKGRGNIFRDLLLCRENEIVRAITDRELQNYVRDHESALKEMLRLGEADLGDAQPASSLFMRIALSCLVDADHTDTAHHYNNAIPEGEIQLNPSRRLDLLDDYITKLFEESKKEKLSSKERERNELRWKIYNVCRDSGPTPEGFVTCDSPVGTGKTTAVMAHLLNVAKIKNLRRIFVVLPFTNIIDQSVDVYRKSLVLESEKSVSNKVVAAHHHKAEYEELQSRVFSFLWNAPITVTTAVQFFETLANNRPASLRKLHQLAGSAIFIDEAHAALPALLWAQGWKWLQELVNDWGCYIVLATGSLNRFWELEEFSEPPIKGIPELVDKSVRASAVESESVRINYVRQEKPLQIDEICDWIKSLPGPRLIIFNTVQSASSVAKKLLESYAAKHNDKGFKPVEHLSTALAPIHRETILNRVKARILDYKDNDWTLVATSCVEAGMDFSFRTAAREFCSLVSTIQTAGRINRSGEFGISDLWNFQIVPGKDLREHPSFTIASRILKQMFDEGKITPKYCTEAMMREVREKNQTSSENNSIVRAELSKDFVSVEGQFKVITANTVTAIIDAEICKRIEHRERIDFFELQQKSVSIYSNNIKKYALESLHGFDDLYVWMLDYDADFLGYMAGVLKLGDINSYVI